jgi:hypothetical protein
MWHADYPPAIGGGDGHVSKQRFGNSMPTKRSCMFPVDPTKTVAFSEASIEEVETVTSPRFEQIDEHVSLIESFSQPYPLRARDRSVMDGEMDRYG